MSESKECLPAGSAVVRVEIQIDAPVERTWQCMVEDVTQWWRQDFLICQGSKGMFMDQRIGGHLYEKIDDEGGGHIWGNIISFQPPLLLGCVAQIVPPWGGPAQSVIMISLEESDGGTLLTLTDSLIGNVTDEMLNSMDEGWKMLYGEGGLKTYVESKNS